MRLRSQRTKNRMSPNDIVVHCADAQRVTLSALGAAVWWAGLASFGVTAVLTSFFLYRQELKDRARMNKRAREAEASFESERRKYENERNGYAQDRAKQKAEHEEKLVRLVEQGNAYSQKSLELNARIRELEQEVNIAKAGR